MLVKPQTFMNLSGQCVTELVSWYKPEMDHLMVVYDDIDLPLGKLRMREKGSAGTHNGMRSVIGLLGRQDFPRLRVGVGKNRKAGNWPTGCSAIIRPRKTAKRSSTRFCVRRMWSKIG